MQKKSKNFKFLKKIFFARNEPKRLMIRSQHHLCSPRKISARYLSKKKLVIFQEICDPGYAKKVKKLAIFEKFFFARNDLKRLKILSQHHLCSPRKFSGPYLSKKKLVIFQEICDPGYAKKVKKFQIFEKNFFRSKRAKTPYDSFATPFVQSTKNFSPVSLKKEVGHFSRNLWPRICKKSQKTGYLRKIFFSLETTQNALKFVRNTICAVHDKFPVGISQKRRWSFFKKSVTPDMQKKSKNFKFLEKFFSLETTLNALKFVRNTICEICSTNFRPVSLKKEVGHFSRNLWPRICKKCQKIANLQKRIFSLETT